MIRTLAALVCLAALVTSSAAAQQADTITVPASEFEQMKARIAQMEAEIRDLRDKLDSMAVSEESKEAAPEEAQVIGGGSAQGVPQTLLPDISVIGNVVGKATTDRSDPDRNEFFLQEAEVALQGYLYPQIRGSVIAAMEHEEDHSASLEEGYIDFLQLGGTDLSARLGKNRLGFGKVNPVHPHHRPYVDTPLAARNFLSAHGLMTQGVQLGYLLPVRGPFAHLDVGVWRAGSHSHSHDEEHEGNGEDHEHSHAELGPGFDSRIYSGRLWTSFAASENSELELGFSAARGKGTPEDHSEDPHRGDSITISGLDLTYRMWPETFSRVLLQAEGILHRRGGHNSFGYYGLASCRWSKYWEAGLRYDWSERPYPGHGHDSGLSAILTNHLTETTKLRLQVGRGSRAGLGSTTEGFLQVIWGIGPHSHPLE